MTFIAQSGGEVTRPTFYGISHVGEVIFYYLAVVAILILLYGAYERVTRYAQGAEDSRDRLDNIVGRIVSAVKIVGSNEKQFDRDFYAGVMHTFIMWGFLTLLMGTTILAIDIDFYRPLTGSSFWVGDFYLSYEFVMDAMGLLFVVGIGMAMYSRYWVRKVRLWGKHTSLEDDLFIWTLFVLGVGGFLLEGLGILGRGFPGHETVSFVGYFIASTLDGVGLSAGGAQSVYTVVWWVHAIHALAFVAAIPYAKPFHMLSSFANVVTRDEKAGARLPGVPADLDATNAESIDDFTWKEILDQDACTKCGRCSSV